MAKLSLSEVSQRFNISRSTLYRSIKEGRLSRSSDGLFDIAEVIRCFGEPKIQNKEVPEESIKKDDADLRQLVEFMKREIESYKDREKRYLDQIDRFQLLIGHKENPENLSHETPMTQTNSAPRDNENDTPKSHINKDLKPHIESHDTNMKRISNAPQNTKITHYETPKKEPKKRGLFSRVLDAVLSDN